MWQRPAPKSPETLAPLVPYANYRVLTTKFSDAASKSSGLPMITLDLQILSPDSVKNDNGTVSRTAGVEGRLYLAFSDGAISNTLEVLEKLGVPLPPSAATFEDDAAAIIAAARPVFEALTFEMVVSSKREARNGPNGQPLTDSEGRPIQGREQADFNSFNIVGLPKPLSEVGGTATPY